CQRDGHRVESPHTHALAQAQGHAGEALHRLRLHRQSAGALGCGLLSPEGARTLDRRLTGRKEQPMARSSIVAKTLTAGVIACALMIADTASANVLGTWSITWDWSHGDGGSGTTPITFTTGHLFSVGQEGGRWAKSGRHLTLHFATSNTCH